MASVFSIDTRPERKTVETYTRSGTTMSEPTTMSTSTNGKTLPRSSRVFRDESPSSGEGLDAAGVIRRTALG